MRDSRAVHKFLPGNNFPWFAAGKDFVNGSDAHKNDFPKMTAYLASFVQHGKGRGQKFSAFHSQSSGGRRHGGRFSRGRGGCGFRGVRGGRGGGGSRGAKPYISTISYNDKERALLSYDEKGKVFALRNKYEPRKINAVEILESSIAMIFNISAI